jgi:hypothetical protein
MINKQELEEKLKKIDEYFQHKNIGNDIDIENEIKNFSKDNIKPTENAVLGLDIYKYSEYDEEIQNLIPLVFDLILDESCKYVKTSEPSLFRDFNIKDKYISTGDGAFIIFDSPIHALIFNLYFYAALHLFNTGHFYPKTAKCINEIIIRSALTFGNVFHYEDNYYGEAIIMNARILSKDKLNRFLIDKKVYDYFSYKLNGIESLPIITSEAIKDIFNFKNDFKSNMFYKTNDLPKGQFYINDRIRNVHVQKIEGLFSKNTPLVIYNIEIQLYAIINDDIDVSKKTSFILSIGNTNTSALE